MLLLSRIPDLLGHLMESLPVSSPLKETVSMENFGFIDVDPIPRELLRRADDFFGVLFFLTLPDKLAWSQVPK